jgi:tetratricopeptide (TPR) repeat protein
MNNYTKALSCVKESLKIRKRILPENHPHIVQSLINLGLLCCRIGEYNRGERFLENALKKSERNIEDKAYDMNDNFHLIAVVHKYLALAYATTGKYSKASRLMGKALRIFQKEAQENHPEAFENLTFLANFYEVQDDYGKVSKISIEKH